MNLIRPQTAPGRGVLGKGRGRITSPPPHTSQTVDEGSEMHQAETNVRFSSRTTSHWTSPTPTRLRVDSSHNSRERKIRPNLIQNLNLKIWQIVNLASHMSHPKVFVVSQVRVSSERVIAGAFRKPAF